METHITEHSHYYRIQKTLAKAVSFSGVGLHSGVDCHITVRPQKVNFGIQFQRKDVEGTTAFRAHYSNIVATTLATSLGDSFEPRSRVATVEHLMAALYALGINNVLVEVSGPEIPILDGSAEPFVTALREAGVELQPFTVPFIKVIKPIKIFERGGICELLPRENLRLTTSVEFTHPKIGIQIFALEVSPDNFHKEVSAARTFGFLKDFEKLKSNQLALGASLNCVLGFSEDDILNEEGVRFPDECVRHKLLDALGDLALCGFWIQGELVSYRGGHAIHLSMLKELERHPSHVVYYPAEPVPSVNSIPFTKKESVELLVN